MKKYYIAVDCEGVACAVGARGEGLGTGKNYEFACLQATREANAAAKALFDAGAEEVMIWDAHGRGVNLQYDLLDKRCRILLGAGHKGRFVGLDSSWTAVLFIGYHAMGGSCDATLSHTFSSRTIQYYKLDGKPAGELAIDGAYAGELDVPVLFCAGDESCVEEARRTFGPIAAVETKRNLSWNSAITKHPLKVCEEIYASVFNAAQEGPCVKPYKLPKPLEVEIRFSRADEAAAFRRSDRWGKEWSFADAFTRKGEISSVRELF